MLLQMFPNSSKIGDFLFHMESALWSILEVMLKLEDMDILLDLLDF